MVMRLREPVERERDKSGPATPRPTPVNDFAEFSKNCEELILIVATFDT